jgi:hypothetical protein
LPRRTPISLPMGIPVTDSFLLPAAIDSGEVVERLRLRSSGHTRPKASILTRSCSRYSWQWGQSARWRSRRRASRLGSPTIEVVGHQGDGVSTHQGTTAEPPHRIAISSPRAPRTRVRPLCNRTRWLAPLIPSTEQTSAAFRPSTSRNSTTPRCAGGSLSRHARALAASFSAERRSSASSAHASGAGAQAPQASKCSSASLSSPDPPPTNDAALADRRSWLDSPRWRTPRWRCLIDLRSDRLRERRRATCLGRLLRPQPGSGRSHGPERLVRPHQLGEGRLVARAESFEQFLLVHGPTR